MQTEKQNNLPLVSICIPTYNGGKFLSQALDSALSQTYSNIEVIITDDCSSDDTIAICKQFVKKDPRVKLHLNKQNLGLVGNWLEVIEKANSDWVKFLFQDDLLAPNCVEKMVTTAIQNKVDFVVCNRTYFYEKGVDDHSKKFYGNIPDASKIFNEERAYTPKETSKLIAPYIFRNCIGEPPTFLLNKKALSREDFPDNYFQLIDYIFILNKILSSNFVYVSEKLVKFRVHNFSESKRNNTVDVEDKNSFHKFLFIKYYENIQLCDEVLNNPLFSDIKKHIPTRDVTTIKNWIVTESYRRYGFENVLPFYKQSDLADFILDKFCSNYSYTKYRIFKITCKKTRKKYKV